MSEPAWRRYARLIRPRTAEDVDAELALHLELRIQEYMALGMSEAEARAATLRRLGDLATARRDCITITSRRENRVLRAQLWDAFVQDIRFALRSFGRQKAWAAAGVLTLALGIGATTAVFSIVSTLLLHPIDYPSADRIAIIFQQPSTGNNTGISIQVTPQASVLLGWKRGARSFEALEGWTNHDVTLDAAGAAPGMVHATAITPGLPRLAGARPLRGRALTADDAREDTRAAAISEGLWRSRFASDPGILRRTITLDRDVYTVVGVMPAAFQVPSLGRPPTDVWLPVDLRTSTDGFSVVGRLRPGVTLGDAARELNAMDSVAGASRGFRAVAVPPSALVRFTDSLRLFATAVALVLLIACANVAHLLLARGATRQRELAIRAALGAGTGRLRRQLVTECMILALAGAGGGIFLGTVGLRGLLALRPQSLTQLDAAHLDLTTVGVTVVLALLTGLVFGLVGSSQSRALATPEGLRAGAGGSSQGRSHGRLRSVLVVTEMALSAALLVGAMLLIRSVRSLQLTDPGFRSAGLYAMELKLPERAYPGEDSKNAFYGSLEERAKALPGITGVTLATSAPTGRNFTIGTFQAEGEPDPPAGATSFVDYNGVEPNYFALMGIPFVAGTTFTDTTNAAHQVIVNEGMVRAHWPGQAVVGKRLRVVYGGSGTWRTIVGVVGNAATGGLGMDATTPMLYTPGAGPYSPALIVRTDRPAVALPALRAAVAELDAHLAVTEIRSIDRSMWQSIAAPRFTMTLLTIFTALAVLLAAVGLYGVMSYTVAQRTREIGIRMALGATRRRIARAILRQGLVLGTVGGLLGLAAARFGTSLLRNLLSGVTTADPWSFVAAAGALLLVILLACFLPMVRAVGVSPQIAMRAE